MTHPRKLDTTWHEHAACRGTNPDTFYNNDHAEQAVTICSTCPVQRDCHTYAQRANEQYGVWGGDTSRLRNTSHHPERLTATSAERILAELHANHTTWTTPHALAERLGYQANTIQKTLRRLQDAGAPIERSPGGYYRITAAKDVEVRV